MAGGRESGDISKFRYDFSKFNSIDQKMIDGASKMIGEEIPRLMKLMPAEDQDKERDGKTKIVGGVFDNVSVPLSKVSLIWSAGGDAWRCGGPGGIR